MNKDKALELLDKYYSACIKRCEGTDVSLGDRRRGRIKYACMSRVLKESGLKGMALLNLMSYLIYVPDLRDMIPDGIKLYNLIPSEDS